MKLSDVEWNVFYLKDIFTEIQRGKRIKKSDHIEGNQPYISSSATTNGVDGFIGNVEKVRVFENCLRIWFYPIGTHCYCH